MSPTAPPEPSALNLRLGPLEQTLLEQAASLSGQSVSDFALTVLLAKARELIQPDAVRVLSERDALRFVELLDADVQPNEALRRGAVVYAQLSKGWANPKK